METLKAIWLFFDGRKRMIALALNMALAGIQRNHMLPDSTLNWVILGVEVFSALAIGDAVRKEYVGTKIGTPQ